MQNSVQLNVAHFVLYFVNQVVTTSSLPCFSKPAKLPSQLVNIGEPILRLSDTHESILENCGLVPNSRRCSWTSHCGSVSGSDVALARFHDPEESSPEEPARPARPANRVLPKLLCDCGRATTVFSTAQSALDHHRRNTASETS